MEAPERFKRQPLSEHQIEEILRKQGDAGWDLILHGTVKVEEVSEDHEARKAA